MLERERHGLILKLVKERSIVSVTELFGITVRPGRDSWHWVA